MSACGRNLFSSEGITPVQTMSISNEDYAEEGCSPPSAQRVAGHSAPLECAFCKSKKEPPEVYKSHWFVAHCESFIRWGSLFYSLGACVMLDLFISR